MWLIKRQTHLKTGCSRRYRQTKASCQNIERRDIFFKLDLNDSALWIDRISVCNRFQRNGPAWAKALSPHDFLDCTTLRRPELEERNNLEGLWLVIKAWLYEGADEWTIWKINNNNLNIIRFSRGNQWRDFRVL